MNTANASQPAAIHAVCPLCERSFELLTRKDGCTVFPTHGHRIASRAGSKVIARKAARCDVSGYSTQGLAIVQGWIDGIVSLGRFATH